MRAFRMLAVLVGVIALLGAACGGDDGGSDDDAESTEAVEETDEVTDEATDEEEDDGEAQSPDEYAATLCGTLLDLTDQQTELVDAYNVLPADDPAVFQADALALVDDFIADLGVAGTELGDVTPDVDDGEDIQQIFTDYIDETTAEVQAARDTLAAGDPNDPAFIGTVTQFEVAINILATTLSDPFAEIDDQDLLTAFDEEPTCEDIVLVI